MRNTKSYSAVYEFVGLGRRSGYAQRSPTSTWRQLRAYVGQCLREDLEKLDDVAMKRFIAKLQAKGVSKKLIADAMR